MRRVAVWGVRTSGLMSALLLGEVMAVYTAGEEAASTRRTA
jgi:hypothetical protein